MRKWGYALFLIACAEDVPRTTIDIGNVRAPMDAAAPRDAALDAARDARVSSAALRCPAMWSECAQRAAPWRVIAEASQFGSGARFRDLAGDMLLVEGGSARWLVVQVGPDLTPGEPSALHGSTFPPGTWEARGLARRPDGVAVIACDARCTLLEGALGGGALREVDGAQLPVGYQVNGLRAADDALCVFGSDVSCFAAGRWQSTFPASDEVIALSLANGRALALTRSQRVFAGTLEGALPEWREQARVDGMSEVALAGRAALFHGEFRWLERSDTQEHACEVPDGVAALLVAFGSSPSVLTGRGDLLHPQADGFCRSQRVQVGEVIAASSGACSGEPRVITATQLIGDNRCDLE